MLVLVLVLVLVIGCSWVMRAMSGLNRVLVLGVGWYLWRYVISNSGEKAIYSEREIMRHEKQTIHNDKV